MNTITGQVANLVARDVMGLWRLYVKVNLLGLEVQARLMEESLFPNYQVYTHAPQFCLL